MVCTYVIILSMNTRHKGNIAVAHAIAYFSTNGYSVFLPVGDAGGAIDLIVSPDNVEVKRVQCKYTARRHYASAKRYPDNAAIWDVNIAQVAYTAQSFDLLFVSTPDGNYLVNWEDFCTERGKIPMSVLFGEKMSKWKI